MKYVFGLFYFILLSANTNAQDVEIPAEAKPFVLPGFSVLDYIKGDLNGDKKQDAILILKQKTEDTAEATDLIRPLLILTRQANGKLKLEKRADHILFCRTCGGMMGDPYQETRIDAKGFMLTFYGGSSWRWGDEYYFSYRPEKKNWFLIKQTETSFQSGNPEETQKSSTITEEEFGETPIETFNSSPEYAETKWKVTSAKTFFYDSPILGSKTRKGYLLKSNEVSAVRELKNFVEVTFDNGKGIFTTGFILKKDVVKVK